MCVSRTKGLCIAPHPNQGEKGDGGGHQSFSVEVGAEKIKMKVPRVVGARRLTHMFNGKEIESTSVLLLFW